MRSQAYASAAPSTAIQLCQPSSQLEHGSAAPWLVRSLEHFCGSSTALCPVLLIRPFALGA